MDQLRVEVPDERFALALVGVLHGKHAEIAPRDDGCDVVIELDGHPQRAVVDALNAVDRWLAATDLGETTVILDGRSYTLPARKSQAVVRHRRSASGEARCGGYRAGAGRLAQLGERLPYKQEVACSSQAPPIAKKVLLTRLFRRRTRGGGAPAEHVRLEGRVPELRYATSQ